MASFRECQPEAQGACSVASKDILQRTYMRLEMDYDTLDWRWVINKETGEWVKLYPIPNYFPNNPDKDMGGETKTGTCTADKCKGMIVTATYHGSTLHGVCTWCRRTYVFNRPQE